ncbi:MAG: hypothetical protein ACR2MT_10010 [Aurantibacter sp.]
MIQRIRRGLKKRKVKVFILFLLASALIWFLNNLSNTYSAKTTFELNFVNSNKDLLLTKAYTDKVDVKLQTMGFQFLGFNFKKKAITLDLAKVVKDGEKYFLPPEEYRNQIEKQLSSSMLLLEMDSDTLGFDFLEMASKKVPVESSIKVNLAHNYLLEGALQIEPPTIAVTGPKDEIDTIVVARTVKLELPETTEDFSEKVELFKSPELKYTSYATNLVQIRGKVSKFSEKIVDVRVEVINLPDERLVRTFPDEVSILCKAKIEALKNIGREDFRVVADYAQKRGTRSNILALSLVKKPKGIFSASLMETKVEYILNKE